MKSTLRVQEMKIEILMDSGREFSAKSNATSCRSIGVKFAEIQPFEVAKYSKIALSFEL